MEFSSSFIGNNILIISINKISNQIINKTNKLIYYNDININNLYNLIDIISLVKIFKFLINNIDNNFKNLILEKNLLDIHEVICKIREGINNLKYKCDIHKEKYLYYLRSNNIDNEINSIIKNKDKFIEKFKVLLKLIYIKSKNSLININTKEKPE